MKDFLLAITCIFFALATVANAQTPPTDDVCAAATKDFQSNIERTSKKYTQQYDELSKKTESSGKKIKDDAHDPSAGGAAATFDIKVTSHTEEFIFDLPTTTMTIKNLAVDMPQISNNIAKWSWSVPETRMVTRCINGPVETVCTPLVCNPPKCDTSYPFTCRGGGCTGGNCTTRAGPQICSVVPMIALVTKEASITVPTVTLKRSEISLNLPDFKMTRQRVVLTVPDFTFVNVKAAADKTQKDSADLQNKTQHESDTIKNQMNTEIKEQSRAGVTNTFACYDKSVTSQRDSLLAGIDKQINDLSAQSAQMKEVKNYQAATQIDSAINQITASRAAAATQFAKAIDDLHAARDKQLLDLAK